LYAGLGRLVLGFGFWVDLLKTHQAHESSLHTLSVNFVNQSAPKSQHGAVSGKKHFQMLLIDKTHDSQNATLALKSAPLFFALIAYVKSFLFRWSKV